ncbi:Cycloartenol Synthase [Asimina triloba]
MWKLKIGEGKDSWPKSGNNFTGRHVWEFDPNLGSPEERNAVDRARQEYTKNRFQVKHNSDLLMRMQFARENPCEVKLPPVKLEEGESITDEAVNRTLRRAIDFYSTIQAHDGHWPNDHGGLTFLLPGLVIGLHIVGALNTVLSAEHQRELRRYIYNHQNADGGWGLHTEGHSIMFCTALFYVALRLLGEDADGGEDGAMMKARKWVLDRGGATAIPSWGKMWLSVIWLIMKTST